MWPRQDFALHIYKHVNSQSWVIWISFVVICLFLLPPQRKFICLSSYFCVFQIKKDKRKWNWCSTFNDLRMGVRKFALEIFRLLFLSSNLYEKNGWIRYVNGQVFNVLQTDFILLVFKTNINMKKIFLDVFFYKNPSKF